MPEGVCGADWGQVNPPLQRHLTDAIAHGGFIYLWGLPGRGKSCAAAAVYRRWSMPEGNAKWWDTSEVINWLMKCKLSESGGTTRTDMDGNSYQVWPHRIFDQTKRAGLVVFDDVGLRKPTEPQEEALTHLVNLRAGRTTIFTSNLSDRELEKLFHPRLASRILSGTVIEISGDDRRQEGARYRKA